MLYRFSLHANVEIKTEERKHLQKLARYAARPPLALDRMSEREDGKILYRLKTGFSDGSTHVLFDPIELVEKVVALIAPARANLVRYSGILGPHAKIRKAIVPKGATSTTNKKAPGREAWAKLLKRTFAVDVLRCNGCGGVCGSLPRSRIPK